MHLKVNSPDCVQVIFFLSQVIFSVQIESLFWQVLYFFVSIIGPTCRELLCQRGLLLQMSSFWTSHQNTILWEYVSPIGIGHQKQGY